MTDHEDDDEREDAARDPERLTWLLARLRLLLPQVKWSRHSIDVLRTQAARKDGVTFFPAEKR